MVSSVLVHAELSQHAARGLGVKERNQLIRGSFERQFMDQTHARLGGLLELSVDIIRRKFDVMNPLPILFDELRNRTIVCSRFQQFDVYIARFEESSLHLL